VTNLNFIAPVKPAEYAEKSIIRAIIDDTFPINSSLPPERDLAAQLGVTRPTLREALQRLARDGWLEIHQGKNTRVKDYWKEGNLNVLFSLSDIEGYLPEHFIIHLLQVRALLCPTYTRLAILRHPEEIVEFLNSTPNIEESAPVFSTFDLALHTKLTILSGNPVFTLILNGFHDLIEDQSKRYFLQKETRVYSARYYDALRKAAVNRDPEAAFKISEKVMKDSIQFWQQYVKK